MNKLLEKRWLNIFIGIFIIVNAIFVIYNFVILKGQKASNPESLEEKLIQSQIDRIKRSEFYNAPCPEIILTSIESKKYDLKDLIGNVIIIKFSKFYKRDLPNLIYLEHVSNKYSEEGVSLLFINSLGKHYSAKINKICRFNSPIIEDNGEISGLFNAGSEDIVIIDREFNIKFKYPGGRTFNKSLIFNEVMRWTFPDIGHIKNNISYNELSLILNQLTYFDVFKKENIPIDTDNKRTIITLFTSMCMGCEENLRIQLLKKISQHLNNKKSQIIILFGVGNNTKATKEFAKINDWNEFPFHIGVMTELNIKDNTKDYYNLFSLKIDPRTFVLNKKEEVVFAEDFYNSKSINSKLLLKKN